MSAAHSISATIGVVVPCYNRARLITGALDSVLAQTLAPKRLVIVDDGSEDDSRKVVRQWRQDAETEVEIVRLELVNGGVGRARNRGLALLEDCDFVLCLDSDDCLPEDFLMRAAAALVAAPEAVAASAEQRYAAADGLRLEPPGARMNPMRWMFFNGAGILSSTLLRRERLMALGGFDPSLLTGQDSDILIRLSLAGKWLPLSGAAVEMRRDRSDHSETRHLHKLCFDARRRWALLHQRLWQRQRAIREDKKAGICRWVISRHWSVAAAFLFYQRHAFYQGLPWHLVWRDIFACCWASLRWDRSQFRSAVRGFLQRRLSFNRRAD